MRQFYIVNIAFLFGFEITYITSKQKFQILHQKNNYTVRIGTQILNEVLLSLTLVLTVSLSVIYCQHAFNHSVI